MSHVLIFMLEKIPGRIQFGLVDNIGHRSQSAIPGFSLEMINGFQISLRYHSASFFQISCVLVFIINCFPDSIL